MLALSQVALYTNHVSQDTPNKIITKIMRHQEIMKSLQDSPYIHNWVKQTLPKLDDMDVIDVLRELETLQTLFLQKRDDLASQTI